MTRRAGTQTRGPQVTVEVVVFTIKEDDLAALLVRRSGGRRGAWALPRGAVRMNESVERAALRELESQTGLTGLALEQFAVFSEPGPRPNEHEVAIGLMAFMPAEAQPFSASGCRWVNLGELSEPDPKRNPYAAAFGQLEIVSSARRRVMERLVAPFAPMRYGLPLLPSQFTLQELLRVYEVVLGRALKPRVFKEAMKSSGLIEPVAPGRTALYRWSD